VLLGCQRSMTKKVDSYTLLNKTVKMSLLDEFRLVESSVNYYYPKTLKWPPKQFFKLFIYFKMTTITTIYSMQTQNFKQKLSWWQELAGVKTTIRSCVILKKLVMNFTIFCHTRLMSQKHFEAYPTRTYYTDSGTTGLFFLCVTS
jgi:hypothetical protein